MPALPLPLLALQSALLSPRALTTTGPHAPLVTTHPRLNHTIYTPANLSSFTTPVPAVIWANDACTTTAATGAGRVDPYEQLNREVASWGFVVFACGEAGAVVGVFSSESADAHAAADAGNEEEEKKKRAWANVETTGFGMLGSHCGGAGVYAAAEDARVLSLAIVDVEGGQSTEETRVKAANVTKPVFYFETSSLLTASLALETTGGARGVKAEFSAVAQGVPAWFGFLPGVDGEVVKEGGAGKLGRAVRFWASWMLKGEEGRSGSAFFTEEGAEGEGWTGEGTGLGVLVL